MSILQELKQQERFEKRLRSMSQDKKQGRKTNIKEWEQVMLIEEQMREYGVMEE